MPLLMYLLLAATRETFQYRLLGFPFGFSDSLGIVSSRIFTNYIAECVALWSEPEQAVVGVTNRWSGIYGMERSLYSDV